MIPHDPWIDMTRLYQGTVKWFVCKGTHPHNSLKIESGAKSFSVENDTTGPLMLEPSLYWIVIAYVRLILLHYTKCALVLENRTAKFKCYSAPALVCSAFVLNQPAK